MGWVSLQEDVAKGHEDGLRIQEGLRSGKLVHGQAWPKISNIHEVCRRVTERCEGLRELLFDPDLILADQLATQIEAVASLTVQVTVLERKNEQIKRECAFDLQKRAARLHAEQARCKVLTDRVQELTVALSTAQSDLKAALDYGVSNLRDEFAGMVDRFPPSSRK